MGLDLGATLSPLRLFNFVKKDEKNLGGDFPRSRGSLSPIQNNQGISLVVTDVYDCAILEFRVTAV